MSIAKAVEKDTELLGTMEEASRVLYNRTLTLIRVISLCTHWMVGIIWSVEPQQA